MTDQTSSSSPIYQFGPFLLDPARRLLLREDVLVPVTAKAFDILVILVSHRDRVVSKDELLELVWPGVTVEENTLTRHISTLRKAIGDDRQQHLYLRTVSGYGYEFMCEATEIDRSAAQAVSATEAKPEPIPILRGDRQSETAAEPGGAESHGRLAPATTPRRFPAWLAMAMFALAVMVGLMLTSGSFGYRGAREDTWAVRQFTFQSGLQRNPAWSPDGEWIAFASDRAGQPDIWVQRLNAATPTRVTTSPALDSMPDWSPDGQSIVFRSEREGGGLFVIPQEGGEARKVASFGYYPRWSPNGSMILLSSSQYSGGVPRFYLVDASGGVPRPVRPDVLAQFGPSLFVNWMPGGDAVALWGRLPGSEWIFCSVPTDRGEPTCPAIASDVRRRIAEANLSLERFEWSPSERYLYFSGSAHESRSLWRIGVDPDTHRWIDGPDRLTTGTTDDTQFDLSPNGTRLAFSATSVSNQLWAFPFDSSTGTVVGDGEPMTSGAGNELDVEVAPDGRKLAYRAFRGGRHELWERHRDNGQERLLVADSDWNRTSPLWSPDGTQLAYALRPVDSGTNESRVLALLGLSDGAEAHLPQLSNDSFVPKDWSMDGETLLGHCRENVDGARATCVVDLPATADAPAIVRVLAADPDRNLWQQRFSPDQRWIVFIAVDVANAGTSTLYAMPADGGSWISITDGSHYADKPRWSQTGDTIYYVSDRDGIQNVWGQHFDGSLGGPVGPPFRVTSFNSPSRMVSGDRVEMLFALTQDQLFLPISSAAGELWTLEGLEP